LGAAALVMTGLSLNVLWPHWLRRHPSRRNAVAQ
jgi:hypothetical protein